MTIHLQIFGVDPFFKAMKQQLMNLKQQKQNKKLKKIIRKKKKKSTIHI